MHTRDFNITGSRWKATRLLGVALAGLMTLAGCSRQRDASQRQLSLLDLGTTDEIERMTPLVAEFNRDHPDIRVKVEYVSGGTYEKLLIQLAGGIEPDVVYLNDTAYPDLAGRGAFQALEPFISGDKDFNIDDFRSEALEFGTIDGTLYFLPPTTGTIIIYYNRDLFDEAGIPYPEDGWTWEEFRRTCKRLTVDKNGDGKTDQYGLAGWGLLGYYPMILQNGGKIISEDGKRCLLNSPEAIEALEFVRQLHVTDKVVASETEAAGIYQMGPSAMMAMGKTAMLGSGFGAYKQFSKINWDIVAPPEKKGGRRVFHGGCWAYGISSKTRYPREAWELVKFLTSEKVQRDWVKSGRPGDMPSRKAVVADFSTIIAGKSMASYVYAANHPNHEFQITNYRRIMDVIGREIEPIIIGVVPGTVEQACEKAAEAIDRILTEGE